jgi:hypothetical protein
MSTPGKQRLARQSENMNLKIFKNSLSDALQSACRNCVARIRDELSGECVYAFSIYCASGCTSMGVACSTYESLKRKNSPSGGDELQAFVNMMNAAEWEHVNFPHELFGPVNQLIDEFYDCLFDGEFDDVKFTDTVTTDELTEFASNVFVDVVAEVVLHLRKEGCLTGDPFAKDVLSGLQFPDPSPNAVAMIEKVSERVNSSAWHEKVVRNCRIKAVHITTRLP